MDAATESLSSFVPQLLSRRLAAGGRLSRPEAASVLGAVLLTDIEGFTPLVEGSTRTRAGLEELTQAFNEYFSALVERVYAHGGDVLNVAGDAFLCYWPAESPAALAEATLRAAQTGLDLQRALEEPLLPDVPRFSTRMGMSCGNLILAWLGGVGGKWELVISGGAMREVAEVEQRAGPGSVLLSGRAWDQVRSRCEGEVLSTGEVVLHSIGERVESREAPPRPPEISTDLLRPWLPVWVSDRLVAPEADWLAEVRRVTVTLTKLPDLRDTTPQSVEQAQRMIQVLQEVAWRFGSALSFSVDSKGTTAVNTFGLPGMAHDDDAERAIQAAQTLQREFAGLSHVCGIGIATGRAFCGVFGSGLRRQYTLHGDVINLAAGLMQATPREILCDHATAEAVRGRYTFEVLRPIAVKGKRHTVQTYHPLGRIARVFRADAPLVGRVAERSLLSGRLRRLTAGEHGGTVILVGEAGIGKSRLLSEVCQQATRAGACVLTAVADSIERSTPYFAWRPVFSTIFGLSPEMEPSLAREYVIRLMAQLPELEHLTPLLGSVLPLDLPDNDFTAQISGSTRADNTNLLLSRVLQRTASTSPTVLVVEEAHWLDTASWALLLEVARSTRPLLSVLATRPAAEPAPEFQRLIVMPGTFQLHLEGLSAAELVSLIGQLLGVAEVPSALAEFIQDRVAGHPFFCEELIHAMRERGIIRVANGSCVVGDMSQLTEYLPKTIEGVILDRLDRLTVERQLCLKVAAVVGRRFRYRAVREAYPLEGERDRIAHFLEDLLRLDLIVADGSDPDPAYRFKHVITRDVAYGLMPHRGQRQPLHGAVAAWYEREHASDLTPHFALLAHHWEHAGDLARTVTYLERAGEQALRRGACREAAHFFSRALTYLEKGAVVASTVSRARWERGLGTARYFLGALPESRRHLERALALLHHPVPSRDGEAWWAAARAILQQVGHRLFPHRYLGRRSAEKVVLCEAVECYKVLGQIYYLDGDPVPHLLYLTFAGLNLGEEAGPSPALARIMSNAAALLSLLGARGWAASYAARAIQMADSEGQFSASAYVWHILALKDAQQGKWTEAKAANDRALHLIQQLGDYNLEAEAWVVRATVLLCEGNYAEAPEAWLRARALAERHGNAQVRCWTLLDEVETLLGRDDVPAAGRVLEAALAIPTAASDGSSAIEKQRALATTRFREGRYREAMEAADAVVEIALRRLPTGYHWVDCLAAAVEIYLGVLEADSDLSPGDRASLLQRAARGCRLLRRLSRNFGSVRPRTRLLRGTLLWQKGKHRRARAAWKRARRLAVANDMPLEEARALLELGRRSSGIQREADLAQAAELFGRLGAVHLARLAEVERRAGPSLES